MNDILQSLAGERLNNPRDLAVIVAKSNGEALKLKLLRNGEPQELAIQPVPRTVSLGAPMSVRIVRPGHFVTSNAGFKVATPKLPDDMTVTIKKHAGELAKIRVEIGDDGKNWWGATEEELDTLPPEIRAHVEALLGRNQAPLTVSGDVMTFVPEINFEKLKEEALRQARDVKDAALGEVRNQVEIAKRKALATAPSGQARSARRGDQSGRSGDRQRFGWSDKQIEEKLTEIDRRLEDLQSMVKTLRENYVPAAEPGEAEKQ